MNWRDKYLNQIVCGDCLNLLLEIPDGAIDVVVTDPPYGNKTRNREQPMVGEFSNIMPLVLPMLYRVLTNTGALYCFCGWRNMADWLLRYQQYFKLQNIIIWDKQRHSGVWSKGAWQFTWEGVFYGVKDIRLVRKYMPDVIRTNKTGKRVAMEKPTDIIEQFILASSDEGDIILDPFIGTGSTAVAARNLNRNFIGFEINPNYCEAARNRLAQEVLING